MRIEEKAGRLVIVDFNEFEAYRIASKVEKDGIEFYRTILNSLKNQELREALEFLLQEERNHLRFFENCLSRLREKKEDISEDDDLLNSIDYGIFLPYQSIDELEKYLADMVKTMKMGLSIERNSIRFYELCKDKLSSEEAKNEISRIIAEEHKHKELLDELIRGMQLG